MHPPIQFGESLSAVSPPCSQAAAAPSLRFLIDCPPEIANQLGSCSQNMDCEEGQPLFEQSERCAGLYLLISGQYLRRVDRRGTRLTLAPGRPGELVELAAALGDGFHTYTLVARATGTALLLPMEALEDAFRQYSPLRMHLLEELAREVSRAYSAVWLLRAGKVRRARAS